MNTISFAPQGASHYSSYLIPLRYGLNSFAPDGALFLACCFITFDWFPIKLSFMVAGAAQRNLKSEISDLRFLCTLCSE